MLASHASIFLEKMKNCQHKILACSTSQHENASSKHQHNERWHQVLHQYNILAFSKKNLKKCQNDTLAFSPTYPQNASIQCQHNQLLYQQNVRIPSKTKTRESQQRMLATNTSNQHQHNYFLISFQYFFRIFFQILFSIFLVLFY